MGSTSRLLAFFGFAFEVQRQSPNKGGKLANNKLQGKWARLGDHGNINWQNSAITRALLRLLYFPTSHKTAVMCSESH